LNDTISAGTEYKCVDVEVVSNGNGYISIFPINERGRGKEKSQIEEYWTSSWTRRVNPSLSPEKDDIVKTVSELGPAAGIPVRAGNLLRRFGERRWRNKADMTALRKINILIDRDEEEYLLQNIHKRSGPAHRLFGDHRTQRRQVGRERQVQALFESIEREHELRGTCTNPLKIGDKPGRRGIRHLVFSFRPILAGQ